MKKHSTKGGPCQSMTQSDALLASIVDSSDDAIISKDLNGVITSWNRAAERIFGYTEREAVGESVTIIIPPDRVVEEEMILGKIKRGKRVEHYETERLRKDGSLIEVSLTISPLKDAEGVIFGASKIARDVTLRRKAEREVARSERLLADFFENGGVGLHWVGPDGTIIRVNSTELELLGYSREEYVGRSIADFHVDAPVIEDIIQKLKAGEVIENYEARLRSKDGSIKHVLITSNGLWEGENFVHTRCFTRDITR